MLSLGLEAVLVGDIPKGERLAARSGPGNRSMHGKGLVIGANVLELTVLGARCSVARFVSI